MSRCVCVRFTAIVLISARSVRNAAEPNAGGGGDRNWLPDVSTYGVTPPNVAPAGGPFAIHIPGPVGTVPVHGVVKWSFFVRSTIAVPAARPIATPRVK